MSTKRTLLDSEANEEWYQDCSDNTINLYINREHSVTTSDDGNWFIEIKEESPLGRAFYAMLRESDQAGYQRGIQEYKQKLKDQGFPVID